MIAIASDHGGYSLKEKLVEYFANNKIEYKDLGTNSLDSVDYPDYGVILGNEVASGKYEYGIAICGTGIGISIAANKVKGIRAALVYDTNTAKLAKEHNNANIIALGGRTTSFEKALELIKSFEGATYELRHQKRIDKISKYEESENE